ncbi:MAG: VCBS repeat-containing protein, partial [Armatimonadetes bacterium]|nr:VCBS repeat-containing protein [Armatimonadota bacterium]
MAKPPVMVGDFNVDGRADLVTVESGGTESLVFVWPGKREGVFSRRLLSRVPPLDARLLLKGDFNRDGKPDLAAANPGGSEIVLLTGMGDGTFRSGPPLDIEKGSEGSYKTDYVGAGDFDGDKIPDLLVRRTATLNDPQEWKVYHGNGDGDFGQV